MKPIAVDRDVYRNLLVNNFFPDIRAVWSAKLEYAFKIHQDDAQPYVNR